MESSDKNDIPLKLHPRKKASFLSYLFFCWQIPIFFKRLEKFGNYEVLPEHRAKTLGDRIEYLWDEEVKSSKNPSLFRVLLKMFGREFFIYGVILFFCHCLIVLGQPLVIEQLLTFYSKTNHSRSVNKQYIWVALLIIITLFRQLTTQLFELSFVTFGMKIRLACCSLIYRKCLKLNTYSSQLTSGQVVNLMSNDVNRLNNAFNYMHFIWIAPTTTLMAMYYLYVTYGRETLLILGLLLFPIPYQILSIKRIASTRRGTAQRTDTRIRLITEIVNGIQMIKMYAWEKSFEKMIQQFRKLELHQIKMASFTRIIFTSLNLLFSKLSLLGSVTVNLISGKPLNSQFVFVVAVFQESARVGMGVFFPWAILGIVEANISLQRIEYFMLQDDLSITKKSPIIISNYGTSGITNQGFEKISYGMNLKQIGVILKNASFKWDESLPNYALCDVNLKIGPTDKVAIVGPAGSGKTTLLNIILKELHLLKGSIAIKGTISYASQESWIFSSSIRQNILFGQDMDDERYRKVINVCALEHDINLLPHGDNTIVGERGITLSGGQKARINLARAIYKKADIYLLDDPLSAVDAKVGNHLFKDCIMSYLKDKVTILVTHQVQYLENMTQIYILENGKIAESGTFQTLVVGKNNIFSNLLQNEQEQTKDKFTDRETIFPSQRNHFKSSSATTKTDKELFEKFKPNGYRDFLKAGGFKYCSLTVFFFILSQITVNLIDYFTGFWVSLDEELRSVKKLDNKFSFFTTQNNIFICVALVLLLIIFLGCRCFLLVQLCKTSSKNLHQTMFNYVASGTMGFFNNSPSGGILNRFSKDIGIIDDGSALSIISTFQSLLIAVGITAIQSVINPWMLIAAIILWSLFFCYRHMYNSICAKLEKVVAAKMTPIYSHLNASIQGLLTIRVSNVEEKVTLEFDDLQDNHSSIYYLLEALKTGLCYWTTIITTVYMSIIILSFTFLSTDIQGGFFGLMLMQMLPLNFMMSWALQQWSKIDNVMVSVENVVQYTMIPQEDDQPKIEPPTTWPSKADIEYRLVSMRYSKDEPLVIKGIDFVIKAGVKVGVVGRTGAGKSSLISALFRLYEFDGTIIIDGLNTKDIPLKSLRSKISIIPQDPMLFTGTLRRNLDPLNECTDIELWKALEEIQLKNAISLIPLGLESEVAESGSNFSFGQRQLLCLARAMIRGNRILVLDEATASIDFRTDEIIQETIRKRFKDCTVLTVAHRLNTVMDSDKILVMEDGRAVEYDHPHILLQKPDGYFSMMVNQNSKAVANQLINVARQSYFKE